MDRLFWIDLETGGLTLEHSLLEIGIITPQDEEFTFAFTSDPGKYNITEIALSLNKIDLSMHVKNALTEEQIIDKLTRPLSTFWGSMAITPPPPKPRFAGWNTSFDHMFLQKHLPNLLRQFDYHFVDVWNIWNFLKENSGEDIVANSMVDVADYLKIDRAGLIEHTGIGDARIAKLIYEKLTDHYKEQQWPTREEKVVEHG